MATVAGPAVVATGRLRCLTDVDGTMIGGNYPFRATTGDPFRAESLEFLAPDHDVDALRLTAELNALRSLSSEDAALCYPGREGPV